MGRNYLIVMICLGLFGAIASGIGGGSSSHDASAFADRGLTDMSRASRSSDDTQEAGAANGDALVLDRESDGHFYASVEVNGTPIRMLVDTGASGVALSREDARRASIATSIAMPTVVGEGAGGEVRGEVVTIDRIALGGESASGIRAVVLDGGDMSLLGQNFLREFGSVEISGDRMVLR